MHPRHFPPKSFCLAVPLVFLGGCEGSVSNLPPPAESTTSRPLASVEGNIEASIDAPWRIETTPTGLPPIPLIVTVFDAAMQEDPLTRIPLGQFCELRVIEKRLPRQPVVVGEPPIVSSSFAWGDPPGSRLRLIELQRSDKWPTTNDVPHFSTLCRRWAGESCDFEVGSTAEWQATFSYTPSQYDRTGDPNLDFHPGDVVELEAYASFSTLGASCGAVNEGHGGRDRLERVFTFNQVQLRVPLKVTVGNPMPRFGAGWVYGDVHYHSQGTDNEGETGYAYRPTLQAMRAIGLDFVFATDHASDSIQTTDVDEIYLDRFTFLPSWTPQFIEDLVRRLGEVPIGLSSADSAARDMNDARFKKMHANLNESGVGANAEVLKAFPSPQTLAPQIFLGGEVDVIPEMSDAERLSGELVFGNQKAYLWAQACNALPPELAFVDKWTTLDVCTNGFELADATSDPGRWTVKDIQGFGEHQNARQHLVHLPFDPSRDDTFVSSDSGKFGGGGRRLKNVLREDYEQRNKGLIFLAHPVDAARGNGIGRLGPDIVPYSNLQLLTAFESPAVLGLELWNENRRMWSSPTGTSGWWENWLGETPPLYDDLHDGLYAWDKMLQWGLLRSRTAHLAFLAPGEPRRVFMAGGSDAHGDWNFRREGALRGTSSINDTAIGTPRNLVNVGLSRTSTVMAANGTVTPTLGQTQVAMALQSGEFVVTDGPILRIAIDQNGNGVIDPSDTAMGSITDVRYDQTVALARGSFDVLLEWKSTPEFGPVGSIDLYVGSGRSAELEVTHVYAPVGHGVHGPHSLPATPTAPQYLDADGRAWRVLADGYLMDPTGLLHVTPANGEGFSGTRRVTLRANSFTVGRLQTIPGETTTTCTLKCNKAHDCWEECVDVQGPNTYAFAETATPDRLYVRAMAKTGTDATLCSAVDPAIGTLAATYQHTGKCVRRMAFTNPIWLRNNDWSPSPAPAPVAVIGESCVNRPCTSGSFCALSGFSSTCRRLLSAGERCGALAPCVSSAVCENSVCVTTCNADPDCTAAEVCETNRCAPRTAIGDSCETRPCVPEAACVAEKSERVCRALPMLGEACTVDLPCQKGQTCAAGTCAVACESAGGCSIDETCVDGACLALKGK